jgi:alanine racemase
MHDTASATIDLTALRANLAQVRDLCPHSRVMAVVKADAYGHGATAVARALSAADGFAVARLLEAVQLRRAGVSQRILLLGTILDAAGLALCSEQQIDVTAHDQHSLSGILECAARVPLRVWLKLDCGMHRLGFAPLDFLAADRVLSGHRGILELVHMTHFSHAHEPHGPVMERQLACFAACHGQNRAAPVSMANSALLMTTRAGPGDWVRPGIMLYGVSPLGARSTLPLRPVMTLRARIMALRDIGSGESVGYDGCWRSQRPSRIATIAIGYADGYPRHARNGTPVRIGGQLAALVGRVSMDSIGVDVTDCGSVAVGDEATLWGQDLPVGQVAECAQTNSYQLLASVSPRVTRVYLDCAQVDYTAMGGR